VATETPWALDQRGTNNFDAVARLRPGSAIEPARLELASISATLAAAYPATNTGKIAVPLPLLTALVGDVRTALLLLECAVLIVLGLATANLAGLLVARGRARRHDTAVRLALGARYRQLVAGLTAEGLVLAAIGTVLGITFAILGHDALMAALPASLPRSTDIHIDGTVVAFGTALALGSGLILILVPTIDISHGMPSGALGAADRTGTDRGHQRLLGGLVVTEVALAVVVLAASVLLGRTFLALDRVRLGFDPEHVVFADLVLPESRYSTIEPQSAAFRGVVRQLASTPGVEAAASVIGLPLGPGGTIGHGFAVEGQPPVAPGSEPSAEDRPVTGDYFGALRIPIVRGRAFTDADDERAVPVAIVNETLATQTWPAGSALGHRVRWVGAGDTASWMTIVGVAGDVKSTALTRGDRPAVYVPYLQRSESWQRFGTLVVRGSGDAAQLERAIRAAVRAVDPLVPVGRVAPMLTVRARAMAQQRFDAIVLGVFSVAALILAVQGIYGTLAYVVEQQRREIGIRVAMGATPRTVRRVVVGRGMRLTAAGVVLGVVAAVVAAQVASGLLYGVTAGDPSTYLAVSAAIAAAAWLGALVPAVRASRADPLVALRGSR
jgi:putative ABC transport system permease protein